MIHFPLQTCEASRIGKLTQENVFEGNYLRMPWEVLAGFVCATPEQGTFHKGTVFQRTTKAAILNLGA